MNHLTFAGCLIPQGQAPPSKLVPIFVLERLHTVNITEVLADIMPAIEGKKRHFIYVQTSKYPKQSIQSDPLRSNPRRSNPRRSNPRRSNPLRSLLFDWLMSFVIQYLLDLYNVQANIKILFRVTC